MRLYSLCALALLLFCGNTAVSVTAAKKPARPPVKAAAAKPKPTAQPTAQLPGDNGVFGTVYTIRKGYPLYFRLKSAEFTTEQVKIGEGLYAPNASEKLLVIHFTIQNPSKSEQFISGDSLKFTAVDAMNVNHEYVGFWGDEKNKSAVDMSFKPTQTLDIYSVIKVPAKGIIPKLMILPPDENDGPILRYDLKNPKNKVTPLSKPAADPSDPSGYTALETVPGELNVSYPFENYDMKVLKFETVANQLGEYELEEGESFFAATIWIKCEAFQDQYLRWDTISPMLLSSDEEEIFSVEMMLATANRPVDRNMKPGDEITVRIIFKVPQDVTPKTLVIQENESRSYSFEVE